MIQSLQMRLLLGTTIAMAVILGVLAIAVDRSVAHELTEEFDDVMLQKARALASMVEKDGSKIHFDYQRSQFREFEPGRRASYFEIWLDDAPTYRAASLPADSKLLDNVYLSHAGAREITLPDDQPGRVVFWQFKPFIDGAIKESAATKLPSGIIAVAHDTHELDHTLGRVQMLTLTVSAAMVIIMAGTMSLIVRRTMRPVNALAQQIESLGETDLRPLEPALRLPLELHPVVERLNGLLRKLATAFERERMFTADVAHELRTPIAGLLAVLQVSRTRQRDPVDSESAMDRCIAISRQMQGLVERLLVLTRADGGQLSVRREPVDPVGVLLDCWVAFEPEAQRRGIKLTIAQDDGAAAAADRELLGIVVSNLLDNAVNYSQAGGQICVRITSVPDEVRMEIRSTGHSLTAEDVEHVCDRFWRKDTARTGSGAHAGLGLSLCRRLVTLQGGRFSIWLEGDEFVAQVVVPAQVTPATLPSEAAAGR